MSKLLPQTPMPAPPGWRAVFFRNAADGVPYAIEPVIAFVATEHDGPPPFIVWVAAYIDEIGRLEPVDDDECFVRVLQPDENPPAEELAAEARSSRTFIEKLKQEKQERETARSTPPWRA